MLRVGAPKALFVGPVKLVGGDRLEEALPVGAIRAGAGPGAGGHRSHDGRPAIDLGRARVQVPTGPVGQAVWAAALCGPVGIW
jgi:hypothetical protein